MSTEKIQSARHPMNGMTENDFGLQWQAAHSTKCEGFA